MATFALIHGGDGSGWDWHLVARELREDGHDPTAVDLPCEDESARWWDYADAVVEAIGDRSEVVVVGHSLGGFTAPLVCARIPVDLGGAVGLENDDAALGEVASDASPR
jgi:pimeloyl-ACP methyl ester carboxylesterase